MRQIVVRQIERPMLGNEDDDLQWFCNSLGIGEGRDVERIATRVLFTLLDHQPHEKGLPVDTIAKDLAVSSSRINHHIRNLVDAGAVYRHKRLIYLRGNSLRSMVQEIRKDVLRLLDDLELAATEIDQAFGIVQR
ncbi:MAG: Helix-turn-helix domain protein [Methanoregulaceae archaeon PtaB.Bin056]|jgi:predicted transcriptional regulator|nr:MAG: Helix-turn-helix domain protein [Methanoregulaceae archaeon PtaB.Bin056]